MTVHKGISLYPGLGMSLDEMLQRLEEAAGLGVDRLFLSFHIPETDPAAFECQVAPLLARARALGLAAVGDLVPGKPVPDNLPCLRLDDGFTPDRVAELQRDDPDRTLVLNASAVTESQLEALQQAQVDFGRVEALHNFYPHPHTGISVPYFLKQNALLRRYGIPSGAFVASQAGKRGPLHEGLPTLEQDRHRSVSIGARQLAALVEFCRERGVKTIFTEAAVSPKTSQSLAREVGAKVVPIHTLEGSEGEGDYLQQMEENLERIYESLK